MHRDTYKSVVIVLKSLSQYNMIVYKATQNLELIISNQIRDLTEKMSIAERTV